MVSLGNRTPLVALVLVATLFAGCVGDEGVDPDASKDGGGPDTPTVDPKKDPAKPDEDTAKAGCKFQFCIEGHVYAPVWEDGMTWTYDVTGSFFPVTDYSATLGVFKTNDDHFLLGTDSDVELKNSVARFGVMTGPVQKDSYGILEHDEYQDLLGFLKIEDTTWKAKLWDLEWTLAKLPSKEIEHAKGKSLGIEVNGATEGGDTLLLQYASDAAWLTKVEWKGPDGALMLAYTLTDYNHDGNAAGMKIWDKTKSDVFRAAGNTAPAGGSKWVPGPPATYVLAHVETDEGITGNAFIVAPDFGQTHVSHTGPQTEDFQFAYQEGDWHVAIVVDRAVGSGSAPTTGNMAVFMYGVAERTA